VPYRTAAIHREDVIERQDGIRITSRPRTALDLARVVTPADLRSIIEQAMHDGSHTAAEMSAVAADWLSPRRSWVRVFLDQLARRTTGAAAESHFELVLAEALRAAGVGGLETQFHIELPGYGPARFDLAVPSRRWAIEVDVFPTHGETVGRAADQRRDRAASSAGWCTSRVGELDFGDRLPQTVAELMGTYARLRTVAA
jgi:hypothetical protein